MKIEMLVGTWSKQEVQTFQRNTAAFAGVRLNRYDILLDTYSLEAIE